MEAAESQRPRFYARSDVSGTCFRDAMFAIAGQILCIGPMVAQTPQDPCIFDKGDVVNLAQLRALAPEICPPLQPEPAGPRRARPVVE
jgi:hypothetical protein